MYIPWLCVIITIMFIYFTHICIVMDTNDIQTLTRITHYNDVKLQPLSQSATLQIENVIENYRKKRQLNKSRFIKVLESMQTGFTRGCLSTIVMGGNVQNSIISGLTMGMASATASAYTNSHPAYSKYLMANKHI